MAPRRHRASKSAAINLELLRLFLRVGELSSISAAARDVNVSPSLATRKIAAFERALDARLFERTTRNVKLTEPGRIAMRWARDTLDAYDGVQDGVTSLLRQPSGQIRLAVNHFVSGTLASVLGEFCRAYPKINLSITVTDSIVHLVQDGFDLAVHSGSLPDDGVVGLHLLEFRRVICAAPTYTARRGVPRHPSDLASHDCIAHSAKESTSWCFQRGRRTITQPIRPYVEANTNMMLVDLARAGLGIVRVGRAVVTDDLAAGRLVELMAEYKCVYATGELPGLWLVYPNRRVLYRTRVLIDFLSKYLGSIAL